MESLFNSVHKFTIKVYPDPDWSSSDIVTVEVIEPDIPQPVQRKMTWREAYIAFAQQLEVNEHQLSAVANGLSSGRVLRFEFKIGRADLESAGFI